MTAQPRNAIRACILVFYYGGPSQLDTYDLKPNAPAEVRGEFRPIATTVPGLQVCEHLPRMARWMHKAALIRSMTHQARLHDSASIHALTGRPLDGPDRELFTPLPQVYPSHGSAVAYLQRRRPADVPCAALPFVFHNVVDVPCQGGGMLGSAYNPLRIDVDAGRRHYQAELLTRTAEVDAARSRGRQGLSQALEVVGRRRCPASKASGTKRTACSKRRPFAAPGHRAGAAAAARALRLRREPVAVGEGGGGGNGAEMGVARHMRGQNLLLARRLVEAGVPFVNVYDFKQQGQNWDAHFKGANQHKTHLLPQADQSLSALIEDLDTRGLLESTLVVAMGEFGRTPRINDEAGRDHWPDCYTVLLAGGGVRGGAVYGASDRLAAYPATDPVTPADLAATIFWRFGFDPQTEIHDQQGRPHVLSPGQPLRRLFGG